MNFDRKIKSLTELLEDNVLDVLLFDSCALGWNLFRHGSSLRLSVEEAKRNNVNMRKVREARQIARISLELLQREEIRIAPVIYGELSLRIHLLEDVVSAYGARGWHEKRGARGYRKRVKKESRILRELLAIHHEMMDLIGERLIDTEEAQGVENLAIEAYKNLGFDERPKNDHDERLVGDAIYIATRFGLYVGVVTHGHRIKPILQRVQMAVANGNGQGRGIREELEAGKVTILRELDKRKGFQIEYYSSDFRADGREVPRKVMERVEALV